MLESPGASAAMAKQLPCEMFISEPGSESPEIEYKCYKAATGKNGSQSSDNLEGGSNGKV
jgi:hypothetical protein